MTVFDALNCTKIRKLQIDIMFSKKLLSLLHFGYCKLRGRYIYFPSRIHVLLLSEQDSKPYNIADVAAMFCGAETCQHDTTDRLLSNKCLSDYDRRGDQIKSVKIQLWPQLTDTSSYTLYHRNSKCDDVLWSSVLTCYYPSESEECDKLHL